MDGELNAGTESMELAGGTSMEDALAEMSDGLGLEKPEEPAEELPAAAPAPSPAPSPAPAATPAPSPAPASSAAPALGPADLSKPPSTWTAAAQAKWAALDPELRAEVHKREQDMWRGLDTYKAEAQFGVGIKKVLGQELLGQMKAANVMPEQFIHNITQAHLTLSNPRTSVEQKQAFAVNLLKQYGIEIGTAGEAPYVDPQVKSLQDEIEGLKSKINGREAQEATQAHQRREEELIAFAADPAHSHFYEVADEIVLLLRGSGGQMKLQDAYERAVRANPVTWAKEVTRLQTEAVDKANKEATERAAAAKKASAGNVKSGKHRASATAASGSMDETMEKTLADINSRA